MAVAHTQYTGVMFCTRGQQLGNVYGSVGGKAKGLWALRQAGLPVPPFVALSDKSLLLGGEDLAELVVEHLGTDKPLAIRSSATDEDGSVHSFAGMHESVLNVVGVDDVYRAINHVVSSFTGERALAYRAANGLGPPRPAVVAQEMVAPMYSGVAFTSFEANQGAFVPQVELVHGMGEPLVSGHCIPSAIVTTRIGSHLGDEVDLVVGEEHDGLKPVSNKELLDIWPVLRPLLERIHEHFGPSDVEFCLDWMLEPYVVQRRPVTA